MAEIGDLAISRDDGQLFYCHQCRHRWMKTQDSDFFCPVCNEGFIEQINVGSTPARHDNTLDPIFTLVNRIYRSSVERRAQTQGHSSRGRSRSPRSAESPNLPSLGPYSISIRRRPNRFSIDELMSQLASASGPPPINNTSRLEEIPKITITPELTKSQCSICFDEFKENEPDIRKLPTCPHFFHETCIFSWLRINGTCPVCRASQISPSEAAAAAAENRTPSFESILAFMRNRSQNLHAPSSARSLELQPAPLRFSLRSSSSAQPGAQSDSPVASGPRRFLNRDHIRNVISRRMQTRSSPSTPGTGHSNPQEAQNARRRDAFSRSRLQYFDFLQSAPRRPSPATMSDLLDLDDVVNRRFRRYQESRQASRQESNPITHREPPQRAQNVIDLTASDTEARNSPRVSNRRQSADRESTLANPTLSSSSESETERNSEETLQLFNGNFSDISSSSESSTSPLSDSSSDSELADGVVEE